MKKVQEVANSVVAYAEVYSAFRRVFLVEKRIIREGFEEITQKFERDWRGGCYTLKGRISGF